MQKEPTMLPRSFSYNQLTVHDWMKNIRTPTPYRVGNARLHLKPRMVFYGVIIIAAVLILLIYFIPTTRGSRLIGSALCDENLLKQTRDEYDFTYPLTKSHTFGQHTQYKIAIVTDLDQDSKSKLKSNKWLSYMTFGNLTISEDHSKISVNFDRDPTTLSSSLSQGGRGMELSELVVFNGKLYTVDDRTGVVYEIWKNQAIPWVLLADGNGKETKGFKCEWASVKDGRLYVGGLGKEWTTGDGEVVNLNPQWVKSIGPQGDVQHHDWHEYYNALRRKTGTLLPGYMIHESCVWSSIHQRWFFLPRRASDKRYDENTDERQATNLMLTANEDFSKVDVIHVGKLNPTHGFSSFKFIPGTNHNIIVALKSEEDGNKKASYLLVFTIDGKILLPEIKIGDKKYEGIEFV